MNTLRRISTVAAVTPRINPFGHYSLPLAFFTVGCAFEAYTGTRVKKEEFPLENRKKITVEYSSVQGTGFMWGVTLAIVTLLSPL